MRVIYTKTKQEIYVCDADYHLFKFMKWNIDSCGYARSYVHVKNRGTITILMHHLIMGKKPNLVVDHINQNKTDNRRCNLRFTTRSQNAINSNKKIGKTSKFKGVSWDTKRQKFVASLTINNKFKHLGFFENEVDAALARDKAAKDIFGEYAYLNFNK